MLLDPGKKSMTVYKVRGRICAVMSVVGTMGFVLFLTQFYGTDRDPLVEFFQPSQVDSGLRIEGTAIPRNAQVSNDVVHVESSKLIYSVVFDAGSTGSRVHVFKFKIGQDSPIQLLNETFEQVKPGLSSYSSDPIRAALSLDSMLNTCNKIIPASSRSATPLVLKATAGLRLLQEGEADNIMNEVTSHLRKYLFKVPIDGVGIMDGVDEGVFSWITVNFMLGKLGGSHSPVPALDLGGGSTQITFVPENQATLNSLPDDFLKTVNLFQKEYHLYTHSYLNLGLMSARFTLTGGDKHADADPGSFDLSGPCIPTDYAGKYSYGGKEYQVRGGEDYAYSTCEAACSALVRPLVKSIEELSGKELYIFSYFFDRAEDANLIDSSGGTITVGDFKTAAEKEFKSSEKTTQPFLSLDLTYIYSLLHHGYHISDNTVVHLRKKISGIEVSWALGAAFQVLTEEGLLR